MHISPKLYAKYFPNPLLRAAAGGALVLALTLLVGSQDYNGAGDGVIRRMLAGETIDVYKRQVWGWAPETRNC